MKRPLVTSAASLDADQREVARSAGESRVTSAAYLQGGGGDRLGEEGHRLGNGRRSSLVPAEDGPGAPADGSIRRAMDNAAFQGQSGNGQADQRLGPQGTPRLRLSCDRSLEHSDRDEQLVAGSDKPLALLGPALPSRAQKADESADAAEYADDRGHSRIKQIGPGEVHSLRVDARKR
ncbi:hypothetical protein ACWDRB_62960 [Nonomuraea sp. NPDC003707]